MNSFRKQENKDHGGWEMLSASKISPMLGDASVVPEFQGSEEFLNASLAVNPGSYPSDLGNTVAAFLEAAQQCRPRLMRLARRFADNREEAEDIVQEALLNAFKFLPQFRGDSKMTTWLGAIVLNAGREWVRKKKGQVFIPLEVHGNQGEAPLIYDVSDPRPDPEQTYQSRERVEALLSAIEELTMVRKIAIQMCTLGGLSHLEAANSLGVNVSTIKARISQGKGMLKQKLCLRTVASNEFAQSKRMAF